MRRGGIGASALVLLVALSGCAGHEVSAGSPTTSATVADTPTPTASPTRQPVADPCPLVLSLDELASIWPDAHFSADANQPMSSIDTYDDFSYAILRESAGMISCGWDDGGDAAGVVRGIGVTAVSASLAPSATSSFECDEQPRFCSADIVADGVLVSMTSAIITDDSESEAREHGQQLVDLVAGRMGDIRSQLGVPTPTVPVDCDALAAAGALGDYAVAHRDWETQDGAGEIVPTAYLAAENAVHEETCTWSRGHDTVFQLTVRDGVPAAASYVERGEDLGEDVHIIDYPVGSAIALVADGTLFQLTTPDESGAGPDARDHASQLAALAAAR